MMAFRRAHDPMDDDDDWYAYCMGVGEDLGELAGGAARTGMDALPRSRSPRP
jgi:hypothetical protein